VVTGLTGLIEMTEGKTMKKMVLAMVAMVALQTGAAEITITNYVAGYVCVPSTFTNAGNTGLSPSNAYACIPVKTLTALTETQAAGNTNGDIRAFMYALVDHVYGRLDAATNAPANLTIVKAMAVQQNGTNIDTVIQHTVTTKRRVGTSSIPAE
jgi:hypothetical protein